MTQTWQVGDVHISRVVELEVPVPYRESTPFIADARPERLAELPWLRPHFVTPEGHLITSVHALVVDAPGLKLVVDTCIGNDKPRRMTANQPLNTAFLDLLAKAGSPAESIDTVLCTHLHVDHVGWNTRFVEGRWVPTFPNARYLIGRIEYEHWSQEQQAEPAAVMNDSVLPLIEAGLVDLVDLDHRLSDEVRLLPTPGHTPGHVSVMIESRGARAVITGDVMHHPCQIGRPQWTTSFDSDRAAGTATRMQLLHDFADSGVLVIGTHFATPTAGQIKRDGETFRFDV